MQSRHSFFSWMVLALLACIPSFAQNSRTMPAADAPVTCKQHIALPIALAPDQRATYIIAGELCATEDELRSGTTVQLLIHGATYNHDYWDFGKIDGITYSYARTVAARGIPTFAIDLPGAGESSHPASSQVTLQAAAFAVHQIVQALRNGSVDGIQFGKVILVGHSLGSVVVWEEAINFADVDGLIVTGAAHSITTKFLNANALYPAVDDRKFEKSALDSGYLTTIPGTRITLFYSTPDFDPEVLAADERRKDVVPGTELTTGLPVVTSTATLAIQVPVLTVLGGNDFTTCGPNPQGGNFDCSSGRAVATQEVPFYSPEARIHGCVIPDSGHDVNLVVNHPLAAADMITWSFAFVGQLASLNNQGLDGSYRGLPWNDGLPWNCGAPAQSK